MPGFADDEIPADVVTKKGASQLRTSGNTLSFWTIRDAGPDDLREIAPAIASAFDRVDGFELTWIETKVALDAGLELQRTPGETKVPELAVRHVDIARLDLRRLATVASSIALAVRNQGRLHSFTSAQVLDILADAVEQKRLHVDNLRSGLQPRVRSRLAERRKPTGDG